MILLARMIAKENLMLTHICSKGSKEGCEKSILCYNSLRVADSFNCDAVFLLQELC